MFFYLLLLEMVTKAVFDVLGVKMAEK